MKQLRSRSTTGERWSLAVKAIFPRYFPDPSDKRNGREPYKDVFAWFAKGNTIALSPELSAVDYAQRLDQVDGLRAVVARHVKTGTPTETASTMEFVLEALYQNSLVGKDQLIEEETTYNDIMGSMLSSLGSLDDDEDFDEDDFYQRYR